MLIDLEYVVEENFFFGDELSSLNRLFEISFDRPEKKSRTNVVEFGKVEIFGSDVLNSARMKIESYFALRHRISGVHCAKVWMVKSQARDSDPTELPYLPHFDKHRYLKAMIYLHHVEEDHGPIHFGRVVNPSDIEARRRVLPANYKDLGSNTVRASEMKSGLEPVLGKAGDVVFFDTNVAHSAGIVKAGFERRVIRFDFDVPGFNPGGSSTGRLTHFSRFRFRMSG